MPGVILPVADSSPFCSVLMHCIWIDSEHAIASAADAPEGNMVGVPKEHAPSVHALGVEAQKGVWTLVSEVRGRLRTGLVPDRGFSIGFLDGLTATVSVPHIVIHAIPRRVGDGIALSE